MNTQRSFFLTLGLLIIICSTSAIAQKFNASYIYDSNGNRTKATVLYLVEQGVRRSMVENIDIDEKLDLSFNLYPNPTEGIVKLEMVNATDEQLNAIGNAIRIWDIQGKLLINIDRVAVQNNIDLSSFSDGTYIVLLQFAGKPSYLKIIKN